MVAGIVIPRADAWLGRTSARRISAGLEALLARAGAAAESTRREEGAVTLVLAPAEGRGEIRRAEVSLSAYEWDPARARYLGREGDPPPGERVVVAVEPDGLIPPIRWVIGERIYVWRPFARMMEAQ